MWRGCRRRHRIMSTTLAIGSRLPAFHTALGRIQLGFLGDDEIWRRLRSIRVEPYTPSTITDLSAIVERIREDQAQGFSIVDEELERGLRSIAVPLVTRERRLRRAPSTFGPQQPHDAQRDARQFLPRLRAVAAQISRSLASRPDAAPLAA